MKLISLTVLDTYRVLQWFLHLPITITPPFKDCLKAFEVTAAKRGSPWWRHQMETFSALLAICAGNSPVPGEFPAQRPVTRSFDVFFDLRLNKRLSKQSRGWWFETLSRPLWCHCNAQQISDVRCSALSLVFHIYCPDVVPLPDG